MTIIQYSIIAYIIVMVVIGLYYSRKVKNSVDYVLAGRALPFFMAFATVFATWFGSESILGASTGFVEGGFANILHDPFGAALCLIIVGLFFNRKLYKLNHLTIGDYYKARYNTFLSVILSLSIILSYFGWVAAQLLALGIIIQTVFNLKLSLAILIALLGVVLYAYFGGMYSIALLDTIQAFVIVAGLITILLYVLPTVGGLSAVMDSFPQHYFNPFADFNNQDIFLSLAIIFTGLITVGFGSIPQQDIYQRAMSAKDEKTSVLASVLGGIFYFFIVMIPILIAAIANLLYPDLSDKQILIPHLLENSTNSILQIIFFGAVISAIMSTASAAMLAPATLLAENIIRPFYSNFSDKFRLNLIRGCVLCVSVIAFFLANNEGAKIYELVAGSYSITLVAAFAPLLYGLYTKSVNSFGAIVSVFFGTMFWLFALSLETDIPSTLIGFLASTLIIYPVSKLYNSYQELNIQKKI